MNIFQKILLYIIFIFSIFCGIDFGIKKLNMNLIKYEIAIITDADETSMSKAGNRYLRYYLIEAANSVKNHIPSYKDFYLKKYNEVKSHQHKRALTSRKLIHLIFGLMNNN